MSTKTRATIDDLYKVEGKAELVNGEIVHMSSTGRRPGRAGGLIYASLLQHERSHGGGMLSQPMSGLRCICPIESHAARMRHGTPAPILAWIFVTVRLSLPWRCGARMTTAWQPSGLCTRNALTTLPAGTLVVWDVDLLSEDVIRSYKASDPENPVLFWRGEIADAEPAVPRWRMAVAELFG